MSVRLQAVLFDMDGLLVDTEHAWFAAERHVMAELGGAWTDADAEAMVGGPLDRVARFMVDRAGHGDPARVEELLVDTMADLLEAGADHRPGADDLLEDLVTARDPVRPGAARRRATWSTRSWTPWAATASSSPSPATRSRGPSRSRTPISRRSAGSASTPASCVVLEDSPTGMAAGQAAGCLVVGVPFAVPLEPGPGRVIVASLTELSAESLDDLLAEQP